MILDRVKIENFRSIKELELEFNPKLKILIGKNESGKSNIIRAISLLSKEITPTNDDIREPLDSEEISDFSHVIFTFKFNESERKELREKIKNSEISRDNRFSAFATASVIGWDGNSISLQEYIEIRTRLQYVVNCITGRKEIVLSSKKPDSYEIPIQNTIADIESILSEIDSFIIDIAKKSLPNVIYWDYNEDNLLPSKINIEQFQSNPQTCEPLKILFELAGHTNIHKAITDARSSKNNRFDNLLRRVSTIATTHFNDVWKEYPDISFSFIHNGSYITASIKEENSYAFSQRSDGFKRFVTFLILISASVKNNGLKDNILLFDEPDLSLHPSGIRYLLDELKKISKTNLVLASTHSIFMIDDDCIKRHLIVKKEKETTIIEEANGSNIIDEEVLFNALGYSLFAILKAKNIIFEGWRDKKTFKTVLNNCPDIHKELVDKFGQFGYCQSGGVSGVKSLAPMFEAADRKFLIVTDSDDPSTQRQKEYAKIEGADTWKTYTEIDPSCKATTGEDFLKIEYLQSKIGDLKREYPELNGEPSLAVDNGGVIKHLKDWINKQNIAKDSVKKIIETFKTLAFEDLAINDIDDSYFSFLERLYPLVEGLSAKDSEMQAATSQ